jgi:hypothetical protein
MNPKGLLATRGPGFTYKPAFMLMLVRIEPGDTVLARMPTGPQSHAICRISMTNAALLLE